MENMLKSTKNQISILSVVLFSILLIIIPSNVYAEEIEVKSFSLDETTILQVTNYSNESLDMFRIWLGNDNNFKSFKTEKGWSGEKTPQGVIIFTSTKSLEPQETVKFGIKTNEKNSGVNWKALNKKSEQIDIGKVLSQKIPQIETNLTIKQNVGDGIKTESIFRIIPEKPNVGSSIRVTGDNFGVKHEFDFYVDTHKVGSFTTDDKGFFITTMKIPDEVSSGRSNFIIKDNYGTETEISLRIGDSSDRVIENKFVKLTIKEIPNILNRGDTLKVSGTAQPGSVITLKITNPDNEDINVRNVNVDNKGKWIVDEEITIPVDAIFGKYNIIVSNGRDNVLKSWSVESNKKININTSNQQYELGDILKFEGTVIKNENVEIIIEDPLGNEIYIENIQANDSGYIKFEHKIEFNYNKGTYKVTISQGVENEEIFVGVGEYPKIPINIQFDKLNYNSGEIAKITFSGEPLEIINLMVIDPSDMQKGEIIPIKLRIDGKATHHLELKNYHPGIYTAQVSKGNSQNSEQFSIGLQTGSGEITLDTTKSTYYPGESILLLGKTGENIILTISIADPNGKIIKEKEIFSDKNGIISDDSFRISNDALKGIWTINGKSGANFKTIEIEVLNKINEGMSLKIEEGKKIDSVGKMIIIKVTGAQQNVKFKIINDEEILIDELDMVASNNGEINLPWLIPKDLTFGTYTIVADDSHSKVQVEFQVQ